jgi:diguanylate cyclase (GGDEF)-like protein
VLSPRSSFDSWVEERRGESEEWTYPELKGARSLRQELLKARIVETERRKREEWQEAARIDDLTGLLTHGAFHDELGGWIESAPNLVTLLYLDLDGFKTVNDRWGHMVGDRLLEAVSGRIQQVVREDDLVGRVGGDEFAVALRSVGGLQEAQTVAGRLAETLAEPFELEGHRIEISASVGISRTRSEGTTADELLNEADSRMYAVKEGGGRGVLGPDA